MSVRKPSAALTLLETLGLVAILGIVLTIAYPIYLNYCREDKRTEAITALLNLQLAEEKYRAHHKAYADIKTVWPDYTPPENALYRYEVTDVNARGYTLTATALGSQAKDKEGDVACKTLILKVDGPTETKTPPQCW